jgi:PAP2 superfamily
MNRNLRWVCASMAAVVVLGPANHALTANEVLAANERVLVIAATGGQNALVQTRTLAMVHAAIHDALNTIDPRFERYAFQGDVVPGADPEAAVAAALHDVLVAVIPLFGTPAQRASALATAEADYGAALASIPDGAGKTAGIDVGQDAAAAIVALRTDDGLAFINPPYTPIAAPGFWQPTPNPNPASPAGVSFLPAILPGWGNLSPFTLMTGSQFRPDPPPTLDSEEYAAEFDEVKAIGEQFSATRTLEQSEIARFWYENSQLGWNRIARAIAASRAIDLWEQARLLALVNFGLADGFIAGWNARYVYNWWRPVTAIRMGDADGNPATIADPNWNTYLNTPAIPDYPSTHSVLGAAAAEVIERFFDDDAIAFTTTSGAPFAGLTRGFSSVAAAAEENADSRVYAGIHFRSATVEGLRLGRKIAKFAVQHYLAPLR